MEIETHEIVVDGLPCRYLAAGSGPPLVLVHGVGESAASWLWVLPALGRTHRVLAPDLPGRNPKPEPEPAAYYTPQFFGGFLGAFLDALGIERAPLVGNSLGGLALLHLALDSPDRVAAAVLVGSSGLGREVSLAQRLLTVPGYGDLQAVWATTPIGRMQRIVGRSALLFARPQAVPLGWIREQCRLAAMPHFLGVTLASLRELMDLAGQREEVIVLDRLPELNVPTLVLWGAEDRVVPVSHGRAAVSRLAHGQLVVIPDCGHQPQVECPRPFVEAVERFLDAVHWRGPRRAVGVREEPS